MSTLRVNSIKDASGGDTSQINSAPPNRLVLSTAQNTTSGTNIDFTGIPSWVKRITVMFNGVSTNGSSAYLIQLGDSGGIETTGYLGTAAQCAATSAAGTETAGFQIRTASSSAVIYGSANFCNLNGNSWVGMGTFARTDGAEMLISSCAKTLSGTLDRVRITTVNGTDVFDAGSVNIMYEG
jgi:hypothetical protein